MNILGKILVSLSQLNALYELLDWNEELATELLERWHLNQSAILRVPASLRASYMASYLPENNIEHIYSLTNWLIENGANSGNFFQN
jgi:hypothetical protein